MRLEASLLRTTDKKACAFLDAPLDFVKNGQIPSNTDPEH
jgi:hypothetical protein